MGRNPRGQLLNQLLFVLYHKVVQSSCNFSQLTVLTQPHGIMGQARIYYIFWGWEKKIYTFSFVIPCLFYTHGFSVFNYNLLSPLNSTRFSKLLQVFPSFYGSFLDPSSSTTCLCFVKWLIHSLLELPFHLEVSPFTVMVLIFIGKHNSEYPKH